MAGDLGWSGNDTVCGLLKFWDSLWNGGLLYFPRALAKEGKQMAEAAKPEKKKVYVETTVVSDATALPTNDLTLAGRQMATREWWKTAAEQFDLFSSTVVSQEVRRGDSEAAQRRIEALRDIPELVADSRAVALAIKIIDGKAVPKEYPDGALHIATAALNAMDYLVSWNFKHITNAQTIPLIRRICEVNGYRCPEICTPMMLQKGEAP